jgi:hypothetical protein
MIERGMYSAETNVKWLMELRWSELATAGDEISQGPGFIAEVALKYIHKYLLNSSVFTLLG